MCLSWEGQLPSLHGPSSFLLTPYIFPQGFCRTLSISRERMTLFSWRWQRAWEYYHPQCRCRVAPGCGKTIDGLVQCHPQFTQKVNVVTNESFSFFSRFWHMFLMTRSCLLARVPLLKTMLTDDPVAYWYWLRRLLMLTQFAYRLLTDCLSLTKTAQ
jgi:hypothetical protein